MDTEERERCSDTAPILPKGSEERETAPPGAISQFYTLPKTRYRNVAEAVLIVDSILSLALWVTGGHTQYFVDSVLHFHFLASVFDLAVLSAVRLFVLITLYLQLENVTLKLISNPYEQLYSQRKNLIHGLLIATSAIQPVYAITKGSLILYEMETNPSYERMHATYNALVISAVAFGLIELCLAFASFSAMRKLKVQRVRHWLNDQGQELDKEGKPVANTVNLKRLFSLAKPELPLLISAFLCLVGSTGAQTAAPFFFGLVVDAAQKSMADLNRTIVILLIIYCAGAIFSMLRAWQFTLAGQRVVARLRKNLFNSIIKQEIAFFDTTRTGELTNRLASDTQVVQNAVTVNVSVLGQYLLQIMGSLSLMFVLNAALTGVLLAVVPVVAIGAVQYGMWMKKLRKKFQDRLADASTTAEECISSIRTVRSLVGEPKAMNTYGIDIDKSYQIGKQLAFLEGGFNGVIGIFSYGAVSLVLWYGGKLVFEGHITPGLLTSFLLYTFQVAMAFAVLSSLYGDFMQAVGASIRIFELMDRLPTVPASGGRHLENLDGGLKFHDVSFTYPSRPDTQVLKDVSFSVKPGEMVALVGPSGGGKSTIVSLIERFYDPDNGSVVLGSCDVKELDSHWFRKRIAMVSQEPTLFACSIKENITYGTDASHEEVVEIAKQANAHDFITAFEEGYDTKVGERGVRLSGGQKQRVAIARALIMNPAILLLDEATSALDAESEHLVQKAIDKAMVNRTVLVIAHRLSTVRNAHKVLVIDKGSIVEEGTHETLLAQDGVYKKLVLRQLMADSKDNADNNTNSIESSHSNGEAGEYPPIEVVSSPASAAT